MKKRLFSLFLILILILSYSLSVYATGADEKNDEAQELSDNASNVEPYFLDTASVTREDIDKDFLDYASNGSTISINSAIPHNSVDGNLRYDLNNVVGVVMDVNTEELISGACVSVNGYTVTTDENGRFQIMGLQNGTYNWTISATDYYDSEYLNYTINSSNGASIFRFKLSDEDNIVKDQANTYSDHSQQFVPPASNSQQNANWPSASAMSSAPTCWDKVRVYNTSTGNTICRDRQTYIAGCICK